MTGGQVPHGQATRGSETIVASRHRYWGLAAICVVQMVLTIDNFIVNLALPTIAKDLDADTSQLQWVMDAFTLTYASTLALGGWLGDRFGRRLMLEVGLVVLGVASVGGAMAGDVTMVIACRALQGIGAGMCSPATLSLISAIFPALHERARAIGIWAAGASLGVALGPVVSGVLLAHFWWGSVFLINIPIIVVVLVASRRWIPESRDPDPGGTDTWAPLLSVSSLGLLVWGAIAAPDRGWGDPIVISAIGGGLAIGVVFVLWELRHRSPMVDFRLLRIGQFAVPTMALVSVQFVQAGVVFLVSFTLQQLLGYSPLGAGMRFVPFALAVMSGGVFSPRAVRRYGSRRVVSAAISVVALGLVMMLFVDANSGSLLLMVSTVAIGSGLSWSFTPAIHLSLSAVPVERSGMASGSSNAVRQAGMAFGVAVTGSLLTWGYRARLSLEGLGLGDGSAERATRSLRDAQNEATRLTPATADALRERASASFVHGMRLGIVALLMAISVAWVLFSTRTRDAAADEPLGQPVSVH